MLCMNCLAQATNKLIAEDIIILEYLKEKGANISQCAISRENIRNDLELTSHKCYTAISRLECFDAIGRQIKSKSSKYFITKSGKQILKIIDDKLGGNE